MHLKPRIATARHEQTKLICIQVTLADPLSSDVSGTTIAAAGGKPFIC